MEIKETPMKVPKHHPSLDFTALSVSVKASLRRATLGLDSDLRRLSNLGVVGVSEKMLPKNNIKTLLTGHFNIAHRADILILR